MREVGGKVVHGLVEARAEGEVREEGGKERVDLAVEVQSEGEVGEGFREEFDGGIEVVGERELRDGEGELAREELVF